MPTIDTPAVRGVPLALGGSDAGTDALADVENAIGSPGDHELLARLAEIASVLEGGDGTDALDTADDDTLDAARGGPGTDACTTDVGDQRSSCP